MIARGALIVVVALALAAAPASAQTAAGFEVVADGFGFAVNVAFAPDGTMYVADKDVGLIRIVRDGEVLPEPFTAVATHAPTNEMGLLGVALHPSFPAEPWVYAYYSDASDGHNHLVRFRAEGDTAVERQDLLTLLPTTAGWHNGGDIAFGPDGKLYVSVGDGHDGARSQDPSGLGGRILRLEPDGSVPPDNPFGADNPTYALGIRNSFGLCFDRSTNDLWETENGPEAWDEINLIEPGANYGWPTHLGPGGEPEFTPPVHAYEEPIVLTGCAASTLESGLDLYFGEGYTGRLHRLHLPGPGGEPLDEVVGEFEGGITDVAATPDGRLWVVTPNQIYRSNAPLLPAASTSASPAPESPNGSASPATPPPSDARGGAFTAGGLIVIALLVGGLVLMRSRLLRR